MSYLFITLRLFVCANVYLLCVYFVFFIVIINILHRRVSINKLRYNYIIIIEVGIILLLNEPKRMRLLIRIILR